MLRGGRTLFARVRLELRISINGPSIGGGPNRGAIARPSHGRDRRHGIAQRDNLLAGSDIPNLELPVGPTADHLGGVGVKSSGHHLRSMTFQHGDRCRLGRIPNLDERVTAGRKQSGAIPAELQIKDGVGVSLPGALNPTVRHAHQPQITRKTAPSVTEGQLRPIGRKLHTHHPPRKAIHDFPLDREGLRVPEPHPSKGSRGQLAAISAPGQRFHRIHGADRPRHSRKPRLLQVMDIDPTHARHRQSMSRRVEGQGGHRSEGGGGQLQRHRPRSRLVTQDTGIPRQPAANPVAEGLDLSGSQLLPGRHVRIGSQKDHL